MTNRRTFPRAARRPMSWVIDNLPATAVTAGSLLRTDLLSSRSDQQRTDVTVTRVRGEVAVGAPDDGSTPIQVFMGIMVVTQQAAAGASSATPDPEIDNADWLWFRAIHLLNTFQEDSAGANRVVKLPRYIEVDSKAQRKMNEENKTLVHIVKVEAASAAIVLSMSFRTLLKR